MSSLDYISSLIDYNYALHRRVWESIGHLTDEQFVQDVPYSHGSIRNQIVHIATVDGRWLRGLKGDPDARRYNLDPLDYPDRQMAFELWEATSQDIVDYVDSLDEESLERKPPGMPGPAWQVIAHICNHGTDHRAQILRLLHDFGAPTFDQDLVLYLWSP